MRGNDRGPSFGNTQNDRGNDNRMGKSQGFGGYQDQRDDYFNDRDTFDQRNGRGNGYDNYQNDYNRDQFGQTYNNSPDRGQFGSQDIHNFGRGGGRNNNFDRTGQDRGFDRTGYGGGYDNRMDTGYNTRKSMASRRGQSNNFNKGRRFFGDEDSALAKPKEQRGAPNRVQGKKESQFRELCLGILRHGTNMKVMQTNIKANLRRQTAVDSGELLGLILPYTSDNSTRQYMERLFMTSFEDFMDSGVIFYESWLQRLFLEVQKFLIQQRVFTQFEKRRESFGFGDIRDILTKQYKCKIVQDDRDHDCIQGMDFCQVLEKLGCIRSTAKDDVKLVFDEYGLIDKKGERELRQMKLEAKAQAVGQAGSQSVGPSRDVDSVRDEDEEPMPSGRRSNQGDREDKDLEREDAAKERQARQEEREAKDQAQKQAVMLVKLSELEKDFSEFTSKVFPEIVKIVMNEIHLFCNDNGFSLRQLFFEKPIEERDPMDEGPQSERQMTFKSYVDVMDFMQLYDKIVTNYKIMGQAKTFQAVFQIYAFARSMKDSKRIAFAVFHGEFLNAVPPNVQQFYAQDTELNNLVSQSFHKEFIMFVSKELHQSGKKAGIKSIFCSGAGRDGLNNKELHEVILLNFNLQKFASFNLEVFNKMLYQRYTYGSSQNGPVFDIDRNQLLEDLKHYIKLWENNETFISGVGSHLMEQGLSFSLLFENILGLKNLELAKISVDQMIECLTLIKFKRRDRDELIKVFDLFEQPEKDTIYVAELLKEAEHTASGVAAKAAKTGEKKQVQAKARRIYHNDVTAIKQHVAKVIVESQLSNFGSLLKGQDYLNNDTIDSKDFFGTLQACPAITEGADGLKEGDIIDLINDLDEDNNGFIELNRIKSQIDIHITDINYQIVLKSKVKEVVDETLIEGGTTGGLFSPKKSALMVTGGRSLKKPTIYRNTVLDIWCGLCLKPNLIFEDHFRNYANIIANRLSEREFFDACYNLEAQELTQSEKSTVFRHLLDLMIAETDLDDESLNTEHPEDFLEVNFAKQKMLSEIGGDYRRQALVNLLLEDIVTSLSESKVALKEVLDSFRVDKDGQSNREGDFVSQSSFKYDILGDYMKLGGIMTDNRRMVLLQSFEAGDLIDINKFYDGIRSMEKTMQRKGQTKVRVFDFAEEVTVNESASLQALPKASVMKTTRRQNFLEPDYIVRSPYNTYLTTEEARRLPSPLSPDSPFAKNMRDIMIRTRCKNLSVEAYFKQFGSRTQSGTELSYDQFRLAVKSLALNWADDVDFVREVYRQIDQDMVRADRGSLDMTELARAIVYSVTQSVTQLEFYYLEAIYKHVQKKNLLNKLTDIMVYFNFNRDFSCSKNNFIDMFRKNLEIPADLMDEYALIFLMQRYVFEHVISPQKSIQQVFYYQFFEELGLKRKGIAFQDADLVTFTANFYRSVTITLPDCPGFDGFFEAYMVGDRRDSLISKDSFVQACTDVGMAELYSHDQLDNILARLGSLQTGLDYATHEGAMYRLPSVTESLRKFDISDRVTLYNKTLSQVFIMSKRIGKSTDLLTLFTEIDGLDGQRNGFVSVRQFVDAIMDICSHMMVTELDCKFLSMKYRDMKSYDNDKVYYKHFYADYQKMEEEDLTKKIYGLRPQDAEQKKTEDLLAIKVPKKFLEFYSKIETWMIERRRKVEFGDLLVKSDKAKDGFLSARQIHDCLTMVGCDLKSKQVGQLVHPLHQDSFGRYSYPELYEFLFGNESLQDLLRKWDCSSLMQSKINPEKAKEKIFNLTPEVFQQCEFRYKDLESAASSVTDGFNRMLETEVFTVFKKVGITIKTKDRLAIETYIQRHKSKDNNTVCMVDMLDYFKVTKRLVNLMLQIQGHFNTEELVMKANKCLMTATYTFEDLVQFLQRVNFDLKMLEYGAPDKVKPEDFKTTYKTLYELFNCMRFNGELKKTQIMLAFGIQKYNFAQEPEPVRKPIMKRTGDKTSNFGRFVQADKRRVAKLAGIASETLTRQQFEQILGEISFNAQDDEKDRLFSSFASNGQIVMSSLRDKLGIRAAKATVRKVSVAKTTKLVEKKQPDAFNFITKRTLENVNKFLLYNQRTDAQALFKEMDRDGSGSIDVQEFVTFFENIKKRNVSRGMVETTLDQEITRENLILLFKALDSDNSRSLDLDEFTRYLDHVKKASEKRKANIDPDSLAALNLQIDRLFRKVDSDASGYIDESELWKLLRPLSPGTLTLADVKQKIKAFDTNSDGKLDQDEFHEVVKDVILEHMTKPLDAIADFRQMLQKHDRNKDGALDLDELSKALAELGVKSLTQSDMGKCIEFFRNQKAGVVEIDELVELVRNTASVDFAGDAERASLSDADLIRTAQKCFFAMRNAIGFDLFAYFAFFGDKQLPDFFESSFLQSMLEKEQKNLPATGLLKSSKISAKNPEQSLLGSAQPESLVDFANAEAISRLKAPLGIYKIKIQNIDNVPTPMKSDSKRAFKPEDVVRREVRCILLDKSRKEFLSNCHIIPAEVDHTGQSWLFDHTSIDLHRQMSLRCEAVTRELALLLELVLVLRGDDGKEFQVTNGWGCQPMQEITQQKTNKIKIIGGSPQSTIKIDEKQIAKKIEQDAGFFSFLSATPKESDVSFTISLDCVQLDSKKLTTMEKVSYFYLPQNFLINSSLVDYVLATQIQRLQSHDASSDFLLGLTRKYMNSTDHYVMMAYVWQNFFSVEAMIGDNACAFEAKIEALRLSYRNFTQLIFAEAEQEIGTYPTRSSPMTEFKPREADFRTKMLKVLASDASERMQANNSNGDEIKSKAKQEVEAARSRVQEPKDEEIMFEGADMGCFDLASLLEQEELTSLSTIQAKQEGLLTQIK